VERVGGVGDVLAFGNGDEGAELLEREGGLAHGGAADILARLMQPITNNAHEMLNES
jgi:hypothetical protein